MRQIDELEMKYIVLKLKDEVDIAFLSDQFMNLEEEWARSTSKGKILVKDIATILINSILRLK